jgi:tRNA-dihydrouridine synthase
MAKFLLGDLTLASAVILSPLERISDVGFRRLCHRNAGAALTWTEMVRASELVRPHGTDRVDLFAARAAPRGGRGANLIDTYDPDTPTGVQLLVDCTTARDGHGVDLLKAALEQLEEGAATDRPEWNNICAIDLNFGCPAPAISRRGAGPAQLRRRSKVRALFEVLHDWRCRTSLNIGAVGAKIRLGNNEREQHYKVYLPVADAAAEIGLNYIAVHARHGGQRSAEAPSWEAIAEVKQAVGSALKVIGNGDIRTPSDVKQIVALTGCDGVMIGRAAMRNPWCLRQLSAAFHNLKEDVECHGSRSFGPSEWPTDSELELAAAENSAWSANRRAAPRYRRFREENFERLRRMARTAHIPNDNGSSCVAVAVERDEDGAMGSWYREWSAAAARRRHQDRLDDRAGLGAWRDSSSHAREQLR